MNMRSTNPCLLSVVVICLGLLAGNSGVAQTYTLLKSFAPGEGRDVQGGLAISGSTLYGTTYSGGTADYGTLYKLNTDGTGFETLYNFTACPPGSTNVDGAHPAAELIVSSNALYGTAETGGPLGFVGTVYRFDVGNSNFTVLTAFAPLAKDAGWGSTPRGPLMLIGSTLYGMHRDGYLYGGIYRINTTQANQQQPSYWWFHLSDGAKPEGGLLLSGSAFYGTASEGGFSGSGGKGTVFKVETNGAGFAIRLEDYPFESLETPSPGLALLGATLYGTTKPRAYGFQPSPTNAGTIFKVDTDGAGYTVLKAFSLTTLNPGTGTYTNTDGAVPNGRLIPYGSALYGTTSGGGLGGFGTVYKINPDGSDFTVLKHFTGPPGDGAQPIGKLVVTGSLLFGTTAAGGTSDRGTVFSISLPPLLTFTRAGGQIILSWPTNAAGYELQSTTDLAPSVWTPASPPPTVVDDQNVVTNLISESQLFYRLIKQ